MQPGPGRAVMPARAGPRVRLATCLRLPEPDPDAPLLLDALREAGVDAEVAAWDDPGVHWAEPGVLTVLRSTWNYHLHLDAFLAWAAGVPALLNPLPVVRWNADKGYLGQLAAWGVPVVPTRYLARGAPADLAALLSDLRCTRAVVKPRVSAASFSTYVLDAARLAEGQQALDGVLAARDAMVQPYVRSVETTGERSLVFVGGALSHAVRKGPRFSGEAEAVSGPHPVAEDERALGERVLAAVQAHVHAPPLLYARVDLARDEQGAPWLMELEVLEPSLFLRQHPPAAARLAAELRRRVGPGVA